MKYYKIYHYSPCDALETIDPAYYGRGVAYFSELRRRPSNTTPYSFYYVVDEPEKVVTEFAAHKYEIYLPYAWKKLIYNLSEDPQNFFQQADGQTEEHCHNRSFQITDSVLKLIKENGYKGWTSGYGLQPALMLFDKMKVEKPRDHCYQVYNYQDETLLENNVVSHTAGNFLFFKTVSPSNDMQIVATTIKCKMG